MRLLQSLQAKVVTLVVVTLSLSVGVVTFQSLNDFAQGKLETDLHALARSASTRATANAAQIEADLRFVMTTPPFQGVLRALDNQGVDPIDRSTMQQWIGRGEIILTGLLRARPHYANVRFVTADGTETFRAERASGGATRISMSADPDFKAVLRRADGRLYAGAFARREAAGLPTIRYAVAVSKDKAVRGALMIEATAPAVFGAENNDALAAQQYMITRAGVFLQHTGATANAMTRAESQWGALWPKIEQGKDGTLREQDKLYAFAPVFFNPGDRTDHWLSVAAIDEHQAVRGAGNFGTTLLATAAIALAVAAALVAMAFSRLVTRPLNRAIAMVETVSRGDLTIQPRSARDDEIGRLVLAQGNMVQALRTMVADVQTSADQVAESAEQIADGSDEVADHARQFAANLQHTAATLHQLTAAIQRNASHANQTNQLAARVSNLAEERNALVGQAVSTIEAVSASAKKTGEIVEIVDGFATQTNILSLNAAVEAARAGAHGRGFAVVAAEIRNLAQRSATAAHEIRALMQTSVSQIDAGSRLTHQAGEAVNEMVAAIRDVAAFMEQIAMASEEQRRGIEAVHAAIQQMDQVTQQDAALTAQAAAAAAAQKEQVARLTQIVGRFKLPQRTDTD